MAENDIVKPANAEKPPTPSTAPVVHTMSKEYRGGVDAVIRKVAPVAPAAIPVAQPKPVAAPKPTLPPMPGTPTAAPVAMTAQKKKSAMPMLILGLGVFLMFAAGLIGYFALKQIQQPPKVVEKIVVQEVQVPAPTPTPVPEPPKKPEQGVDSDSDGLTDVEELRLFGTLVFNPDSDADSFLDGNEVFHLYDPMKINFARLSDSSVVKLYASQAGKFSLFVPASFSPVESSDGMSVTWSIPSGENIKVTSYPNPAGNNAKTWFLLQFPERTNEMMEAFTTKGGLSGLQTVDRLETIVEGKGMIYDVQYVLGVAKSIEYRMTYAMMLNSLSAQ